MSTWSPHGVQKIVAVAPDRVHIESTWAPYRVHVDSKRNVAQCKALDLSLNDILIDVIMLQVL